MTQTEETTTPVEETTPVTIPAKQQVFTPEETEEIKNEANEDMFKATRVLNKFIKKVKF